MLCCLRNYKDKQLFCVRNILTEGVFVTEMSSDAGILILFWQVVWFATTYRFVIDGLV